MRFETLMLLYMQPYIFISMISGAGLFARFIEQTHDLCIHNVYNLYIFGWVIS